MDASEGSEGSSTASGNSCNGNSPEEEMTYGTAAAPVSVVEPCGKYSNKCGEWCGAQQILSTSTTVMSQGERQG
jgi:hypothetical protein